MPRYRLHPWWSLMVVGVGGALLLSTGAAILAAPLTLPLLYRTIRSDRPGRGRGAVDGVSLAALVVGGLTVGEIAWAAIYLAVAEADPWAWLVPIAAGGVIAAVLAAVLAGGTCDLVAPKLPTVRRHHPYLRSDIVTPEYPPKAPS